MTRLLKQREYLQSIKNALISRRFRKILLGYVVVFMLPLIIVYSLLVRNIVEKKRVEVEQNTDNQIRLIAEMVDQKLDYAEYVAVDTGNESIFWSSLLRSSVSVSMECIERLKQYRKVDDFWKDIYYFPSNIDLVYSGDGTMVMDVLTEKRLYLSDGQSGILESFIRDSQSEGTCVVHQTYGASGNDLLFYLVPTNRLTRNYGSKLLFQVDTGKLTKLTNVIDNKYSNLYILDGNGSLIFSKTQIDIPQSMIHRLNNITGTGSVRENGNEYSTSIFRSDKNGWQYAIVMPAEVFKHDVIEIRNLLAAFLVLLVILGICIAMGFSLSIYKPIQGIHEFAMREMPQIDCGKIDELDAVREMIKETMNERARLEQSISQQKKHIEWYALSFLLRGFKTEDWPVLSRAMEIADIQLTNGSMCIQLIAGMDCKNIYDDDFIGRVKPILQETHIQAYLFPKQDIDALVVITSYETGEQRMIVEMLYQELCIISEDVILAVSNECASCMQLSRALNQACSALEWARMVQENGIFYFNEINDPEETYSRLKQRFLESVREGNEERATRDVKNLVTQMSHNHSYEYVRAVVRELIKELVLMGKEHNVHYTSPISSVTMMSESYDELKELFEQITGETARQIAANEIRRDDKRCEMLRQYIQEHYRDSDLSLVTLADFIGVSPNYAGHLFRESMKKGFQETITEMRLSYIKQQLVCSDETIKDIIQSAGYQNVPNFIRKFKEQTGLTPSEFRSRNSV